MPTQGLKTYQRLVSSCFNATGFIHVATLGLHGSLSQSFHSPLHLPNSLSLCVSTFREQTNQYTTLRCKRLTLRPPTCIIAVSSSRKWAFKPLSNAQIIPVRFPGFSDAVYFAHSSPAEGSGHGSTHCFHTRCSYTSMSGRLEASVLLPAELVLFLKARLPMKGYAVSNKSRML